MPKQIQEQTLYQLGLTMLHGIGPVLVKNLVAYCGGCEAVFKTPKARLLKVPGIGEERANSIVKADVLKEAEKELKFISEYGIDTFFFTDAGYPERLKHFSDSPLMLFYKGNANLNTTRTVAVVGTRTATDYGKEVTKRLVAEISGHDVLVISGLAYGIDIAAHQAALDNQLKTVGVLAHGLNTIYPDQHKSIARKMVSQGGLLTEYKSVDSMRQHNFPERNRIVAGLADAVVVVESPTKGGAVITANIANSYNKDVFAVPGRVNDKMSAGCNFLVKTYKAAIVENGKDLLDAMNWSDNAVRAPRKAQKQLPVNLSKDEKKVYDLLNEKGEVEIDKLVIETGIGAGSMAATLLEMEMNGMIVSLPGKRYKLS